MADIIPDLREAVFARRVRGGSNLIRWSAKDIARIRQHVLALSEKQLLGAAVTVAEIKKD